MEESNRRQAWYLARHLRQLSGSLSSWGFEEAALLVGAAAISVGEGVVQPGDLDESEASSRAMPSWQKSGVRHG